MLRAVGVGGSTAMIDLFGHFARAGAERQSSEEPTRRTYGVNGAGGSRLPLFTPNLLRHGRHVHLGVHLMEYRNMS